MPSSQQNPAGAKAPNPLADKSTFWAFIVCIIGFGGFILWSAFAPLAEGVIASGVVVVEDNRKVIQHLEGGIIKKINIGEGDFVKKGDVLIVLDDIAALSQRDQAVQEMAAQLAVIARADALLTGRTTPDFSALDELAIDDVTRAEIISRQQALFTQQRENFDAETGVLKARIESQKAREIDRNKQVVALDRAIGSTRQELNLRLTMLSQQNETIYAVQNLERQLANLQAERASLIADRNQARTSVLEIDQQLLQARTKLSEALSAEMAEARRRALSAEEQLSAAQDVLSRTIITAPQDGKVLNLAFSTIGGVVRAGEPIMEIVPTESIVIAELKVRPMDRDVIAEGQKVKAQLSAYKSWRAKKVEGEVTNISADLKSVPETGETYYAVEVALNGEEIAALDNVNVIPGMPVDAFIESGNRRTFLDYLLEPLARTMQKGTQGT